MTYAQIIAEPISPSARVAYATDTELVYYIPPGMTGAEAQVISTETLGVITALAANPAGARVAMALDDGSGNLPVNGVVFDDVGDLSLAEGVTGLSHGTLKTYDANGNGIVVNQQPRRLYGARLLSAAELDNDLIATLGSIRVTAAEVAARSTFNVVGTFTVNFHLGVQPLDFFLGFTPEKTSLLGSSHYALVGNLIGFNLGTSTNPTVGDRITVAGTILEGRLSFDEVVLGGTNIKASLIRTNAAFAVTGDIASNAAAVGAEEYDEGAQPLYLEVHSLAAPSSAGIYLTWDFTIDRVPALDLVALSSGSLSPAFSPALLTYAANVTNPTASITVTPTVLALDLGAVIKVNGVMVVSGSPSANVPLVVGANVIKVTVANDKLLTKTYTITVTRAA